jgi:predicted transcriptional regulator
VDNARRQGWSWQEIAEMLGVSRQAVHKKHARRGGEPAVPRVPRLMRKGSRDV